LGLGFLRGFGRRRRLGGEDGIRGFAEGGDVEGVPGRAGERAEEFFQLGIADNDAAVLQSNRKLRPIHFATRKSVEPGKSWLERELPGGEIRRDRRDHGIDAGRQLGAPLAFELPDEALVVDLACPGGKALSHGRDLSDR